MRTTYIVYPAIFEVKEIQAVWAEHLCISDKVVALLTISAQKPNFTRVSLDTKVFNHLHD